MSGNNGTTTHDDTDQQQAPRTSENGYTGPHARWTGDHPGWCELPDEQHHAGHFVDLEHWRGVGQELELSLTVFDELGRKAAEMTQGDFSPARASVLIRGGIGSPAAVFLSLTSDAYDIDPALTPGEARKLAGMLVEAADLIDRG